MQYSTIDSREISRLGLGTKRFPQTDVTRVDRLDRAAAHGILQTAVQGGINFFDTGYSHHKGESEAFLGDELLTLGDQPRPTYVETSFFELIDPRFDYVFQKQLKKVQRPCIDFYTVEGVCDFTRMRDIDSGAVDYFFERKEAGEIGLLGFSSELSAQNLPDYLSRYPWDFVRLRVNFFDWFMKGGCEQYEIISEAGLPIVGHAPLRMGAKEHLKPEARAILKEADPVRGEVQWGLLFAKSLDNVATVTCNIHTDAQMKEDLAVFADDTVLDDREFDLLHQAAQAQKTVIPKRS